MAIPVESSEVEEFTPQSLQDAMGDAAPVFSLKAPSERCVRRFRQLIGDDGLEFFTDEQFNAEKLRAIDLYWDEKTASGYKAQFRTIIEKTKQNIALTDEEMAWSDQLDEQLFEAHRPLNVMVRKTGEFQRMSPRYALAVYLAGWTGLETPFRMAGGVIPDQTIAALERELTKLGKEHCPEAPSRPYLELYFAAGSRLNLDQEEEKNSPAPSQPSSNPDASTASPQPDGASSGESAAESPSSSSSAKTKARKGA